MSSPKDSILCDTSDEEASLSDDSDEEPFRPIIEYTGGVTYSHESAVAAIRGYWQFLIDMYLDESYANYPPECGWPQITIESMQPLGKTNEVIELLRHIPYPSKNSAGNITVQIAGGIYFENWADIAHGGFKRTSGEDKRASTDDRGLLDLYTGADGCQGELSDGRKIPFPPIQEYPGDFFPSNEVEWREQGQAWPIPVFFEAMKYMFKELWFYPINGKEVLDAPRSNRRAAWDEICPTAQAVYRENGWPNNLDVYEKTECLRAVERVVKERCPKWGQYFFPESCKSCGSFICGGGCRSRVPAVFDMDSEH